MTKKRSATRSQDARRWSLATVTFMLMGGGFTTLVGLGMFVKNSDTNSLVLMGCGSVLAGIGFYSLFKLTNR